jgi:SagB-type dehydrogenase family enzyme
MTHPLLQYHDATKHHYHRYARSAGHMDWANQPNPFRVYEGVTRYSLSRQGQDPEGTYAQLFMPGAFLPQPLNSRTLSDFLGLSLGLSAWKAAGGSRWSLRINPSSGNLHPTEGYLLLPPLDPFPGAGVCHYNPFHHALEPRAEMPQGVWPSWENHFRGPGFAVVLTTIFWRESWKYGERAFRYCLLDGGHALAALSLAARLHGWALTCLTGAGDDQIDTLLGLDRTPWHPGETEHAELICWVSSDAVPAEVPRHLPDSLVRPFADLDFKGRPNRLSGRAARWPIIDVAAAAARKVATPELPYAPVSRPMAFAPPDAGSAAGVIRRRRSAMAYDPRQSITVTHFLAMLERTLPRTGVPPFAAAVIDPTVDLLLFVHRVAGLTPGLYWLQRTVSSPAAERPAWHASWAWQPVRPDFPLWLLKAADVRHDAMELSCHQEIAGHSAFALAMLAPLKTMVARQPFFYRHLHWECGMIGQVLYLEAEAHGVRGTGIGCFFDEPVQKMLGITDDSLQSLYHFTIGHPMDDPRLATLAPYHHLERQ